MPLKATEVIGKPSISTTKSLVMKANDRNDYLVKFATCETHRSIINEVICGNLAKILRLPIPDWNLIEVDQNIINEDEDLKHAGIQPGTYFASLLIENSCILGRDTIPIDHILNHDQVPRIIAFDAYISNLDRKHTNALISFDPKKQLYKYWIIDHGSILAGNPRNLVSDPHLSKQLLIPWNTDGITGLDSFGPFICDWSELAEKDFKNIVDLIPPEWNSEPNYPTDTIDALVNRDEKDVLDALQNLKNCHPELFSKWV